MSIRNDLIVLSVVLITWWSLLEPRSDTCSQDDYYLNHAQIHFPAPDLAAMGISGADDEWGATPKMFLPSGPGFFRSLLALWADTTGGELRVLDSPPFHWQKSSQWWYLDSYCEGGWYLENSHFFLRRLISYILPEFWVGLNRKGEKIQKWLHSFYFVFILSF